MERQTDDPTSTSSEIIVFTDEEAMLCTRALYSHAMAQLRAGAPPKGNLLLDQDPQTLRDNLERAADAFDYYAGLSGRFADPGQPIELSPEDLGQIGNALHYHGFWNAYEAKEDLMRRASGLKRAEYAREATAIKGLAEGSFALYKALEPIVSSKEGIDWRSWLKPIESPNPNRHPFGNR